MPQGRIVIITGCPGTGKTTLAARLAEASTLEKSVNIHTDDFYHYLAKGYVPPYLPESNEQNGVVIDSIVAAAKRFAAGGYDVIVDGIIGPWFIEPWRTTAQEGYAVHYVVLRADEAETLRRAIGREKLGKEANTAVVQTMWPQFANLGAYEHHAIDTTALTLDDALAGVQRILAAGSHLLA